jgi:hypothetical protein
MEQTPKRRLIAAGRIPAKSASLTQTVKAITAIVGTAAFKITHYPTQRAA